MKSGLFSLMYGVSLFSNYQPAQNKLFDLSIEEDYETYERPLTLSLACRLGKQHRYIDTIQRSLFIDDNYKSYLKAMAYRNLRLYQKAWEQLEPLPSNSSYILNAKFKTLYDKRDIQGLISLCENHAVENSLLPHQRKHILEYSFRRVGPHSSRRLAELFSADSHDSYFEEMKEKYKLLENESKSWEQFLNKYNKSYSLHNSDDVKECVDWLLELPDLQSELGLALMADKASRDAAAISVVSDVVAPLFEKGAIHSDLIGADLKYIIKTEHAENRLKPNEQLDLLVAAYVEGDRSGYLYKKIINTLSSVKLRKKDLPDFKRMVDEGFINLSSNDVKPLLLETQNFHYLYNGLHFINQTEKLQDILEYGEQLSQKAHREFLKVVVDPLVDTMESLPFNETIVELLSQHLNGYHKWDCLKSRWFIENGETDLAESYITAFNQNKRLKIYLYLSKYTYQNKMLTLSLRFSNLAYELNPDSVMVLRSLIRTNHRLGNISNRLHFISLLRSKAAGRIFGNEYDMAKDEMDLLEKEWAWDKEVDPVEKGDAVLHVFNKTLPEVNGYTIRNTEILHHQQVMGYQPKAVSKLGWIPEEQENEIVKVERNGVDHYHMRDTQHHAVLNKIPLSEYFTTYANHLEKVVREVKPGLIHAASNFQNALPALRVAQKMEIPSIYEVRGMWHYTQSTKTPGFEGSERYQFHQNYELLCCHIADKIVCISKSLKEHLISLGIPESKITFVPNGVNIDKFQPMAPSEKINADYDLEGKFVIGFIGSITPYEGLDDLLKALAKLKEKRSDVRFLLVGDGVELPRLKSLTKQLGLEEMVKFVGRVPHDEVKDYYSVVDIFPFPRTSAKVCELVTPLKPYEAMAMGKLVAVSNIPALREMVFDGETGLEFKTEDPSSLADTLEKALNNIHLAEKGKEWVIENRNWSTLAERYSPIYSELLGEAIEENQLLETL
ncbi:glycosyltransferase family 4 protein [Halobacillus litoralis]|uniref:glycosyltransferase family 4 protein n=1 Tax=Halobacillus litoralis TaxID=45668 RepID=UPI001CD52E59|nr:glycosyltransferase family 4 protein [Halobacillus litoralis]MCA1021049.1 glycosyltransferase family 4 protein [Halobacillus litoralis]